jgi:hypothetical protein
MWSQMIGAGWLITFALWPTSAHPARQSVPHCSFVERVTDPLTMTPGAQTDASGRLVRLPYPEAVVFNLDGLVNKSDGILVAVVTACRSVDAGQQIKTIYTVKVEEPIKGDSRRQETIDVEFPGGRIELPAGASTETRMPSFHPPQRGDRLLLFVRRRAPQVGNDDPFILSSGVFSSFGLGSNGLVEPSFSGPPDGSVTTSARGMRVEEYLRQVRDIVRGK